MCYIYIYIYIYLFLAKKTRNLEIVFLYIYIYMCVCVGGGLFARVYVCVGIFLATVNCLKLPILCMRQDICGALFLFLFGSIFPFFSKFALLLHVFYRLEMCLSKCHLYYCSDHSESSANGFKKYRICEETFFSSFSWRLVKNDLQFSTFQSLFGTVYFHMTLWLVGV